MSQGGEKNVVYVEEACKGEKSMHVSMSKVQRKSDYMKSFIFISFPSRCGKSSILKNMKIK